ncbi:TonB-dependent receptor [Cellvibrio sp. OA-2007]|uniref:TonB-dependent receptor n=1 Tax=Cellvibrio sp. OA-2007 TaxID=529823 RepID=UPI00187BE8BC|nr:TonB-dependent receptor [Cellvibrio sp. OA-2007]
MSASTQDDLTNEALDTNSISPYCLTGHARHDKNYLIIILNKGLAMVFHKNQKDPQQATKFKKSMLAVCIMAMGAPSFAQDAPANSSATEEVLVTGVRASLQNAQDIKRESSTVVDAISASDIGSLPDKSVLESLQRVPGVSIERFAGRNDPDHFSIEGSGVTLRGLPQTRSEFNGRDSFSANSGRGLSFQDVPPELMAKVEVFKSQSAKMIEGGISGTINLNTRKPFDSSDRQLAFSAAANYADLSEETKPSISGLFSDRWDTDAGEFGFLISLATSELTSRTDGVAYGQVGNNIDGNGELTAEERFQNTNVMVDGQTITRFAPINGRITSAIQERERNGGSLVGQWRNPDDTLLATVEYVYSDSGRNWLEHNIESDDKIGTYSNLSANGLYVTKGEVNNVDSYTTTSRFSDTNSKVEDFSFRLEFTPSDELKLTGDVQYVKASTDSIDLSIQSGVRANTEFDFTSDRPTVFMTSPDAGVSSEAFFTDPANYYWRSAMDHLEDSEGDEFAIKLDAEYQVDNGWLQSVEAGVRFSERQQDVKWSQYNWGNLSENWAGEEPKNGRKYFTGLQDNTPWDGNSKNGVSYDHNIAFDQFSYAGGHFRKGNKSGVEGGQFLAASEALITNYDNFLAATRPFGYKPAGYRDAAHDGGLYTLAELTNTTERNQAIYLQANFADSEERLTGNVGVRLVKVETESTGGNALPAKWDANLSDAIAKCVSCNTAQLAEDQKFSNGALSIGTVTASFTKALPSLNLRYSIADDVQARFAVSEAISFADIGNLRNYTSISATPTLTRPSESLPPTNVTFEYKGSGGNPNLKPMESTNYDAAVEWYFADAGSVFAGVFYKDMSNFFANEAVETTVTNNGVTRNVLMDLPVNKDVDASITGFEAGYQQFYDMLPAPFDGLGLQLNLTLLDVSGTSPNSNIDPANPPGSADAGFTPAFSDLPLQGMSETTYNIVGMYEKDDLSVRLAYNWRSDYLLTTRDVITKLPIYAQASGQLDGSIFYTINDNFKIGLEGSNLMDEVTWTKMQVTQEGSVIPRNYFINDRRFSIVLKGQF